MSGIQGKVGTWEITWPKAPHGASGSADVELKNASGETQKLRVTWRRDADGLWLETPRGLFGYDLGAAKNDDGELRFRVGERVGDGLWMDLAFVRAGMEQVAGASAGKKKGLRVRSQMPGKILRVLVKEGDEVAKDQPLLVMEAMKMENEIRSPGPGLVAAVKVAEGQAVETGADLIQLS